jgi:hypothetical protein
LPQLLKLILILQERKHSVADEVSSSVVTGGQELVAEAEKIFFSQPVALFFDPRKRANQVRLRLTATFVHQTSKVVVGDKVYAVRLKEESGPNGWSKVPSKSSIEPYGCQLLKTVIIYGWHAGVCETTIPQNARKESAHWPIPGFPDWSITRTRS